jgi:hypothetical protein
MKNLIKLILLFSIISMGFSACKKIEGEGGTGSIKGKVWTEQWNSTFTVKISDYAGADEWVYIVYGNNTSYGDRIRTNYNGEYEFKYLQEGNYKIYVYSEDNTLSAPSGVVAMVKEVKVKKKSATEVDLITIYK